MLHAGAGMVAALFRFNINASCCVEHCSQLHVACEEGSCEAR